jgi:hypothetical protein
MRIPSTVSELGISSEVSRKRIAPARSGQYVVPRRCCIGSRQPPGRTPSALPPFSHVQPPEACRVRARVRSSFSSQLRDSSVHHSEGPTSPTGSAEHSALSMYRSVQSKTFGYSASSTMSAGPLKVMRPVFAQIATFSTVTSE